MFLMRFTERAYFHYSEEDVRNSYRSAVRLTFPNSHFDPDKASDMYNYYLDEYEYCEEMGFDGLMLNEHHNTPTCMGAAMNLEAAILARATKNAKIVLLGNPLPISDNPVRMAEELAEIDLILVRQAGFGLRARHRGGVLGYQHKPRPQPRTIPRSARPDNPRRGLRPVRSDGKGAITNTASSTRSSDRSSSRLRPSGCRAAQARRP